MIKRLVYITLAMLVFISSTGLVLRKHFCQESLRDVALFVKAQSCHARQAQSIKCPLHRAAAAEDAQRKGCCDDRAELVKVDDERPMPKNGILDILPLDLSPVPDMWPLVTTTIPLQDYLNYKPPLLVCDDPHIRLQIFLC